MDTIAVFTTIDSREQAEAIATALVERGLEAEAVTADPDAVELLEERAGNLPAAATAYALVVTCAGDRRTDIAAKALNNGGQVARQLGDLTGAQRRLESAVALAADFSPMLVAIATHNLAGVAGDAGRPGRRRPRAGQLRQQL